MPTETAAGASPSNAATSPRTLVLDDVVNSFDEIGRSAIAHLLTEEFADWQVILLTHDPVFATHNRQVLRKGWLHREIVGWSPSGGLVITDGDPLAQLRARLNAGDAASQLGGIARRALEHELSRPVERLELKLRYQRNPRYTAADFLGALQRVAKKGNLALPVLDRIGGASYFATFTPCTTARPMGVSAVRNSRASWVTSPSSIACFGVHHAESRYGTSLPQMVARIGVSATVSRCRHDSRSHSRGIGWYSRVVPASSARPCPKTRKALISRFPGLSLVGLIGRLLNPAVRERVLQLAAL